MSGRRINNLIHRNVLLIHEMPRLRYISSRIFFDFAPGFIRSAVVSRLKNSSRFYCPVCEDAVGGFWPLADMYFNQLVKCGSDLRIEDFETCNFAAYQCSHCGATDRDRLYALYLADRLPAANCPEFSLLDIAPAAALSTHIKRKYGIRYRTADLFQKNVDDRVDVTAMDCYADNSFDGFICSHVLEHVSDDRKAMAELRRVLKPGGWGIVMVPINTVLDQIREDPQEKSEPERWRRFGQGDHVRVYTAAGFKHRLAGAGFRVQTFDKDHFGAEKMHRCGLSSRSVLYVVEKEST